MIKCIAMKSYAVSLVIPCYNESEHLVDSLPRVLNVLKKLKKSFEVIIIDDLSCDNTVEIIETLIKKQKDNPIRFIKHAKNIGRGGTVTEGIMLARGGIVGFIDIDLEVSPNYIPQFVDCIDKNKADVVIGRRMYSFSIKYFHRFIASKVYALLIQCSLSLSVHDTEAGYKFFKREKILPILKIINDKKWFWDTEIIARSHMANLKIQEIEVLFRRRQDKTSTVKFARDMIEYVKAFIHFKRTWNR